MPKIKELITDVEKEIQQTKDTFAGYSGDLGRLLSEVAQYQGKVSDLHHQKHTIEEHEKRIKSIEQVNFKELGNEIENSFNAYKQEIEGKWRAFKDGSNEYSEEQKNLLSDILDEDNVSVAVKIQFDTEKMYQLLMEELDGRSWNTEKLKNVFHISSLEEYLCFIKQEGSANIFCQQLKIFGKHVFEFFFRRFNEFISHNIVVSSQDKSITKLSHGQQGTIYLRLKLAANLFSKTIIYDQPEDDLDNEFIMSDLVAIFRKIKKYRQVIIVSHNANLVVNADSEQVIIARNEEGVLKYVSGSLENADNRYEANETSEGLYENL